MRNVLDDDNNKLEVIRYKNENMSNRQIAKMLGISRSSVDDFVNKKSYTSFWESYDNGKPIASGVLHSPELDRQTLIGKRFVFTSAQNNTYVFKEFLESLETYCEYNDAELIVGTYTYNLNGFQNSTKDSDDIWFDPLITPYINDNSAVVAKGLIWCGELNILPTAVNPLSGLHSYTKSDSGIVPHAKLRLESIPTHKQKPCKFLYTTGTITKRNYIEKKEGQKASFHHVYSALVAEIDDDGDWFVRQLVSDGDGSFYDLDKKYDGKTVIDGVSVEAINWGDIHAEQEDPIVSNISWGNNPDSILNTLNPKYQFVHDLIDFSSRNHHSISDPYFLFTRWKTGNESVKDNMIKSAATLVDMQRDNCQLVVVESNHDLAFVRWLKNADYKNDPVNAVFFLESQLAQYQAMDKGNYDFSVFEHTLKKILPQISNVVFLRTDESFLICGEDGIECGQHGHLGNNGARGSINSYQKLGTRYNLGHSHACAIVDGVYVAGVSAKLDLGYNKGGSSWSHSHIVTYPNSKRTIITIKNGKKWRA